MVELLLAMGLLLMALAGLVTVLGPLQAASVTLPEQVDVQQRLRVGVDRVYRDVLMAGAGISAGRGSAALLDVFAPVLPYRLVSGSAAGFKPADATRVRTDAITVTYVPHPAVWAVLEQLSPDGSALEVGSRPGCAAAEEDCGFHSGQTILVLGPSGASDRGVIDSADGLRLSLRRGLAEPTAFPPGALATEVVTRSYFLETGAADGVPRLMSQEWGGRAVPVIDHVADLHLEYFGDPDPPAMVDGRGGPVPTYGPSPPAAGVVLAGYPPGENCTFARMDGGKAAVSRLPVLDRGTDVFVPLRPSLLEDGPWCPDAASRSRFDADMLRIRRVRATVRVQSASAALRGPAGPLFKNGGTGRGAGRQVPDLAARFDVFPRNVSLR